MGRTIIVTSENGSISSIQYINPISQKINQGLNDTILSHTGVVVQDITEGNGIQFAYAIGVELKGNTYDCGPLLVQLLTELFSHGTILTPPQNYLESILLGKKCREEQQYNEVAEVTTVETIEGKRNNDLESLVFGDFSELEVNTDITVEVQMSGEDNG